MPLIVDRVDYGAGVMELPVQHGHHQCCRPLGQDPSCRMRVESESKTLSVVHVGSRLNETWSSLITAFGAIT
jgi:hypothetical protein